MSSLSPQDTPKPPRPAVAPDGAFSLLLDISRGLAAFAVLFGHARAMFVVGFSTLAAPSLLDRGVYFLSFGGQAVIVFFVMSGWLVGGTTLVQQQLGRFSAKSYVLQRISRIWLVLVPVMLLGLAAHLIYTALGTPEVPEVVVGDVGWGFWAMPEGSLGPLTFVGNLVGLNTIVVPNYGGNGVLWSLSHEIVFYALMPFWGSALMAIWQRRARPAKTLIELGLVATVIVLLPDYHRFTLLLWTVGALTGAILAHVVSPRRIGQSLKLASWLPFMGALVVTRFGMLPPLLSDLAVALSFLLVLVVYRLAATPTVSGAPYSEGRIALAFRAFAAFSFSLYVLHPLVLKAFATVTTGGVLLQPGLSGYGLFALALAVSIALAWAFSLATENRTQSVRRWLARKLSW